MKIVLTAIIGSTFGVLILGGALLLPGAWFTMLAAGNFGFSQFGLVDCLPVGGVIGVLAANTGAR